MRTWKLVTAPQRRHMRMLMIAWTLPPYETFRFGLCKNPEKVLEFIYDVEARGFHHFMNAGRLGAKKHALLLKDKLAANEAFNKAGIPTVTTLGSSPKGARSRLLDRVQLDTHAVFCKLRNGQGAQNAFAVWMSPDGPIGRKADREMLFNQSAIERAWSDLLSRGDAIIQPLLRNHSWLNTKPDDDLVTVRYISQRRAGKGDGYFAMMEYPTMPSGGRSADLKSLLPIDLASGAFCSIPSSSPNSAVLNQASSEVRDRISMKVSMPEWEKIQQLSFRAHALVPDLWAVAWDWAITPDGPILLEGNSGWSLAAPQILMGQPMGFALLENLQSQPKHSASVKRPSQT